MIRKARATWRGNGRAGGGKLSTESSVLAGTPYSFKTRFDNEKGTNPEELIAAAHAGCFSMTMAFVLDGAGFTPTEIDVEAAVTIEPEGPGVSHQSLGPDFACQGAGPGRSCFCSNG
jgi:osmotically inducible protein OsmC